ncbi:MAG: CHAD domain-containing protein [Roseiarcus sp.]
MRSAKMPLPTKPHDGSGDMRNGRELEIKLKTDTVGLKLVMASRLLACEAPEAPRRTLRSIYFDTAAGDLKKKRMVLRVRKTGRGVPQMGLKWAPASGSFFSRGEAEVRIPVMRPDISLFDSPIAAEIERATEGRPLEPRFETLVKRRVRLMKLSRSEIEVAFDEGAVIAGDRRLPIREIELELKSGEEIELYELAIQLVETLPLGLHVTSKAERGYMLVSGQHPQPVKAPDFRYSADATVDEAMATIIGGSITHFAANWPALEEARHPEAIHQMRVALRRLRAALGMFKRALPCPEFDEFRSEAQRIASALGLARELDVLENLVATGPQANYPREASFETLLAALEKRRLSAYSQALAIMDEPATTLFLLKMQAFLARDNWRGALSDEEQPRLTKPLHTFATDNLSRLHKLVLKRGKGLVELPDAERHKVRIALKNLRYAADFFGDLFRDGEVRAYIRAVARLQDLLGAHNDAVSIERLLHDIEGTAGAHGAKASGIVLGWYGRGTALADADLRKSWKTFKRTKIFWR